jgi:hypothetical protein
MKEMQGSMYHSLSKVPSAHGNSFVRAKEIYSFDMKNRTQKMAAKGASELRRASRSFEDIRQKFGNK